VRLDQILNYHLLFDLEGDVFVVVVVVEVVPLVVDVELLPLDVVDVVEPVSVVVPELDVPDVVVELVPVVEVLVPVDGSGNSMRAVEFALQMARNHPSVEVTLLAVACHYETRYFEGYAVDGELLSKQCQEQFGEVLVKASRVFIDAGVEVKTEMVTGDPGTAITAYVKDNSIDRVIMGSRGLSPFKGMILGSVTYKVLHNVKVPVTVVK